MDPFCSDNKLFQIQHMQRGSLASYDQEDALSKCRLFALSLTWRFPLCPTQKCPIRYLQQLFLIFVHLFTRLQINNIDRRCTAKDVRIKPELEECASGMGQPATLCSSTECTTYDRTGGVCWSMVEDEMGVVPGK